jgi:hypothetical protein
MCTAFCRPAYPAQAFLPTDLAGALKRLDDVEIDALLAAVEQPISSQRSQTSAVGPLGIAT